MAQTSKLRVQIPDEPEMLVSVQERIKGATGLTVVPELQEIDHADLVVEMRLPEVHVAPGAVVDAVELASPEVTVLSSWRESPPVSTAAVACETVFRAIDDPMPSVARRALHDELPTAQWLPSVGDVAGGDRSFWLLAVPLFRPFVPPIVGLHRRRGYTNRFTPMVAASLRRGLAS